MSSSMGPFIIFARVYIRSLPNGYCAAYGSILNVNTMEQFRNFDKATLLENEAKQAGRQCLYMLFWLNL